MEARFLHKMISKMAMDTMIKNMVPWKPVSDFRWGCIKDAPKYSTQSEPSGHRRSVTAVYCIVEEIWLSQTPPKKKKKDGKAVFSNNYRTFAITISK